jgi:hypothetical protein
MMEIDRRSVLTGILCSAAVATVGLTAMPNAAKSMALADIKAGAVKPRDLVEEARATVHVNTRRRRGATVHVNTRRRRGATVHVHRRHGGRRWRCWWHRGRRVCGWRW